jgi:predicted RecB family endonuclease
MKISNEDLDVLEDLVFRSSDDLAVTLSRSLERLETKLDHIETRLYRRISELEQEIMKKNRELLKSI